LSESLGTRQRFAVGIEYDGSAYHGWQIQPHATSIQQCLNEALSVVADSSIECTGAGRTDTGVHASAQVAHFDTSAQRSLRSWLLGVNSNLPDAISVQWVAPVTADFHARFSALARSYRYVILNRPARPAIERQYVWWINQSLDHERMAESAADLVGEFDFTSFRASSCQSHSAVRTLTDLSIRRDGYYIYIDCRANAFLHHMVRNIVGSLVRVGKQEEEVSWIRQILESQDRKVSGMTAPAAGLTLTRVEYPTGALGQAAFPAD
jgi:tRNA pseudouridine38-40 synthase